ncbi:MAG: hypothetical protein GXO32_03460 [Crenarchaeota archaeon]|nr:hypothetical protein [Thermoproteota archaeon]
MASAGEGLSLEDAILIAIAQGAETPDEIARALHVDKGVVEDLLRKLELEGFVKKETRGLIFKKTVYVLTEKGFERAGRALEKLREVANQLRQMIESGQVDEASQIASAWMSFLPLMVWMDLLPLTMLSLLPLELGFLADLGAMDTGGMDTGADTSGDTGGDGGDMV